VKAGTRGQGPGGFRDLDFPFIISHFPFVICRKWIERSLSVESNEKWKMMENDKWKIDDK
jgi:hypothetical protein